MEKGKHTLAEQDVKLKTGCSTCCSSGSRICVPYHLVCRKVQTNTCSLRCSLPLPNHPIVWFVPCLMRKMKFKCQTKPHQSVYSAFIRSPVKFKVDQKWHINCEKCAQLPVGWWNSREMYNIAISQMETVARTRQNLLLYIHCILYWYWTKYGIVLSLPLYMKWSQVECI